MSKQLVWQGSLDMLCGVYCAAHIIALHGNGDLETLQTHAFRNLVHSAEDLKMLSAKHLTTRGYYDFDLVKMVNNLTSRKRRGLEAIAFSDKRIKSLHNRDRRALIRDGAYAIIQEHGPTHWIAAVRLGRGNSYECYDPSLEDTTSRRHRVRWDSGVLLSKPSIIESLRA